MTPASIPKERRADEVGVQGPADAVVRTGPGPRGFLARQVIDGRYRVVDTLGTGSLGTVYLCDEIPTTKRVAVKVFRRDCSNDEEFMDRLRRQVKLAMSLQENRPTILAVSDCGRTRDGGAYLATEYLQGRTLKDIIRRGGPLDVQRALRLACQIAGALDAIHDRGFVHKDVRADNVIVIAAGEEEAAKLKGFEVAGLRDTALVGHLVRAGVIPSNPEYATPEQIEGDQVTARTDIYAFGVLLYEMLAGRVPFSASIPDGVLAKHLQEVPVPLSTFRRGIPPVLELRSSRLWKKSRRSARATSATSSMSTCVNSPRTRYGRKRRARDEACWGRSRRGFGRACKARPRRARPGASDGRSGSPPRCSSRCPSPPCGCSGPCGCRCRPPRHRSPSASRRLSANGLPAPHRTRRSPPPCRPRWRKTWRQRPT